MSLYYSKYKKYKAKYLKLKMGAVEWEPIWENIPNGLTMPNTNISIIFPMKNEGSTYLDIFNYEDGSKYIIMLLDDTLKGEELIQFINANIQDNQINFARFNPKLVQNGMREMLVIRFPKNTNSAGDVWDYLQNFVGYLGEIDKSKFIIKLVNAEDDPNLKEMMDELPKIFKEVNRQSIL